MSGARRAAALAVLTACGTGGGGERSGDASTTAARAIAASLEAAAPLESPWRCALPAVGPAVTTAPAGWTRDGEKLVAAEPRAKLTLAAVAQARGATVELREALRAAKVELVLAVGGMGGDEAESRAALGALVDPAWLVIAVPGDAESYPGHARAVAALAADGAAIVDGASVRLIDTGGAVIGTLPGERWPERLGAGAAGCVHDAADVARTVAALTLLAADRPRVLAGGPAPQGTGGLGAADLAPGGLHAGEPGLAAIVEEARVDLVIHAPIGGSPRPAGMARRGTPALLAAGSLDRLVQRDPDGRALPTGALIATLDARTVSWRFLGL